MIEKQDYSSYGAILTGRSMNTASSNEKYKFTEKERDKESGLDYFGARYYDSEIGKWLSIDPLADKYPGWSPYKFCLDNPLRFVDPDGRDEKERIKAIQKGHEIRNKGYKYSQMDCSAFVSAMIRSTGLGEFNSGKGRDNAHNGVANIAGNSRPVSGEDLKEGNLITFRTGRSTHQGPDGKYDHIGLVEKIMTDENGKTQYSLLISSSRDNVGPTIQTIPAEGTPAMKITGYWEWDTPTYYTETIKVQGEKTEDKDLNIEPKPVETVR